MNAYRAHMLHVQNELHQLKKQANQGEFLIKKDEKVVKLEA